MNRVQFAGTPPLPDGGGGGYGSAGSAIARRAGSGGMIQGRRSRIFGRIAARRGY